MGKVEELCNTQLFCSFVLLRQKVALFALNGDVRRYSQHTCVAIVIRTRHVVLALLYYVLLTTTTTTTTTAAATAATAAAAAADVTWED